MVGNASPTLPGPLLEAEGKGLLEPLLTLLRDGSPVTVREVQASDEAPLRAFLHGLCAEARRLRYCGVVDPDRAAHWAAEISGGRCGLLAHDERGAIVGHAVFVVLDGTHAEVAIEVADDLHGCGLGTILIERLAIVAEQRGIPYFVAEVLCENRAMLDVFREGFDARVLQHDGPEERVEFLTSSWRLARERFNLC
jgi:GNAT superfamily N-acetyltransferase